MNEMLKHAIEEEKEHNPTGNTRAKNGRFDDNTKESMDAEKKDDDLSCETAAQRIEWALGILNHNLKCYESLLADLRLATDAVSMKVLYRNAL